MWRTRMNDSWRDGQVRLSHRIARLMRKHADATRAFADRLQKAG